MAYKKGECYVCEERKPVQDHHLLPREYGGPKNGPTILLCPTCHLACHYEAELFYKTGDFGQLTELYEGNALHRAKRVIDKILQARTQFEDDGKPATDARRGVNLNLTHDELALLHALKKVMGFRSLERLIKTCIMDMIRRQREKGKI